MFGRRRESRARAAQRMAEDAWDHLVDAVDNAGGAARSAGRRTQQVADDAGSSVTAVAGETRRRALAAMDALAGRRPRTHWDWIAGAAVVGLVVGWVAAAARRTVESGGGSHAAGQGGGGVADDPHRTHELAAAETHGSASSPAPH